MNHTDSEIPGTLSFRGLVGILFEKGRLHSDTPFYTVLSVHITY